MHRLLIAAISTISFLGCESDTGDDPNGALEYDSRLTQIYRLDHRIEVIRTSDFDQSRSCGVLTERAHRDLQSTIDQLDPTTDYDFGLDGEECTYTDSPAADIHLAGFEHSPFSCDEFCCQSALRSVPQVYFHALNNFAGTVLEIDGEPYVAIDPNKPCSE